MVAAETVLQFGAGRFLRGFVDRFIQNANDGGQNVGQVVVVQSTPGARAALLNQQPDGYHVLVRGYEDGKLVERTERVRSIRRALLATEQWADVLAAVRSPALRYIVSNATEAGYATDDGDRLDSAPPASMPAKLTQCLWHRFQAGAAPVVLLPCELFEQNAAKLLELVAGQARRWKLPEAFEPWLRDQCRWLNSLVDCMITNVPADHALLKEDPLAIHAEPYALWAIERRPSPLSPPGRGVGGEGEVAPALLFAEGAHPERHPHGDGRQVPARGVRDGARDPAKPRRGALGARRDLRGDRADAGGPCRGGGRVRR